ncbi:MAG: hypothetical protein HQL68_11370, partial [Magnetococcales bacterium]|nr:hypothetical protein [Magnetococcales bacterium]
YTLRKQATEIQDRIQAFLTHGRSANKLEPSTLSESGTDMADPQETEPMATLHREEKRTSFQIDVLYKSSRGAIFEGKTGHISQSSLDFNSTTDPSTLPIGNEGIIQLMVDDEKHIFPGKVFRISGVRIVVRILSEKNRFEALLVKLES